MLQPWSSRNPVLICLLFWASEIMNLKISSLQAAESSGSLSSPSDIGTGMQASKLKPAGEKVAKVPKAKKLPLRSSSGFNIDVNVVEEKVVKPTKREPHADKSIEETYQKKTQLEHILLRPDTYVGSVEKHTQTLWVYEDEKMVNRNVTFVPGLYKIFDEILVNAADNKQRDPSMDTVKVSQISLVTST